MEVRNAEAAEMEGPADALPVDWPVASAGLLIAMPEEFADRSVHLLENRRAESDDNHDVGGDRAQHVADKGETFAAGQEHRTPGGKFLGQLLNNRPERRGGWLPE